MIHGEGRFRISMSITREQQLLVICSLPCVRVYLLHVDVNMPY